MNLDRKQKFTFTMFIVAAFLLSSTGTAVSAPFWNRKEEKKPKSESKKVSTKQVSGKKVETENEETSTTPVVPQIVTPPAVKLPAGLKATDAVAVAPNIDLESISATQRDLGLLATRYDDLRRTHEEQLISLRALASQAKIHSQLLNDLKDKYSTVPSGTNTGIPPGLDASNMEKYRLIRERVNTQKQAITDIAASQQRLKSSLMVTNLPNPPSIVRPTAGVGTPANPSLDAIRNANSIQSAQNAVQSAKEAKEKAEEEKAKMEKEKKEKEKKEKGKK